MGERVNIGIVEHLNRAANSYGSSGHFAFRVPDRYDLKCGEYVLVDTSRGPNQLAQCICDSFSADPDIAFPLLGVKKGKLRTVKAVMVPEELIDEPEELIP